MAADDPDEAGNPKECHEPEGRTHDRQSDQRSDRSVRCGRKYEQGLDGILELNEQSQVDADERTPGAGKHNIEIVRKCSRRRMRSVSRMFLTVATESRGTLVFCCEE